MPSSLKALLSQQHASMRETDKSLQAYHSKGKAARPWDGFWTVTPRFPAPPSTAAHSVVTETPHTAVHNETTPQSDDHTPNVEDEQRWRASRQHTLRWPQYSTLYLEQAADDHDTTVASRGAGNTPGITGTWIDGDGEKYIFDGALQPSGRSIEGATLRHAVTGALLTPVSLRSGYDFQSVEARFEWRFGSPVPTPDSVVLTRHEFPRILVVSCSNEPVSIEEESQTDTAPTVAPLAAHVRVAQRIVELQPLQFGIAPVSATSTQAAATYGADNVSGGYTPARHVDLDAWQREGAAMTITKTSDGHAAAVLAAPVMAVLRHSGKTVVIPGTVDDVVRLRSWRCPAALAYIDFALPASPSPTKRPAQPAFSPSGFILGVDTASNPETVGAGSPLLLSSSQRSHLSAASLHGVGKRSVGGFVCFEYTCHGGIDEAARALSAAARPAFALM